MVSVDVLHVASPDTTVCELQLVIAVPLLLKLTVPPVGTAPLAVTAAENVTEPPVTLGFKDEDTTVDVEKVVAGVAVTVTSNADGAFAEYVAGCVLIPGCSV